MGFRTVVILNNDQSDQWLADQKLGDKIVHASASLSRNPAVCDQQNSFPYGDVIECVHADQQSVIMCDGYSGSVVATEWWYPGQTTDARALEMLNAHASALGYRVVKQTTKPAVGTIRTPLQG